ncbi:MAG: hypothetical protein QOK14_730 [Frankiaceae bacterium]|nr:hypothetical protein [Frankiaceae bacterium]
MPMIDDIDRDGYGYAADDDDTYVPAYPAWRGTLAAAAPYFLAAVVCWIGTVVASVTINNYFQAQNDSGRQPSVTQSSIFQALVTVLPLIGTAAFLVGLLVIALRQHERWRRDTDLLVDTIGGGTQTGGTGDAPPQSPARPDVPAYAQSIWDDNATDPRPR